MKYLIFLSICLFFSSSLLKAQPAPKEKASQTSMEARIQQLEEQVKKESTSDAFIAYATVLVTMLTILAGLIQFYYTKQQEYKKCIWEERKKLYLEVTDITARIATTAEGQELTNAKQKFWELYWGRLSIMEDQGVLDAMVNYGEALHQAEAKKRAINPILSFRLAKACRNSLSNTWQPVQFEELSQKKEENESDT